MKALVQNPGDSPQTVDLADDTLKALQGLVGGYVTTAYIEPLDAAGVTTWANDEGLLVGMRPNILAHGQPLVGPVVFTGTSDDGDTIALTDAQEALVRQVLGRITLNVFQSALVALKLEAL